MHTGYYCPQVKINDYNVIIDGKTFLISQLKVILEHMVTFGKSQKIKEITTQLIVCYIIIVSKNIIK